MTHEDKASPGFIEKQLKSVSAPTISIDEECEESLAALDGFPGSWP